MFKSQETIIMELREQLSKERAKYNNLFFIVKECAEKILEASEESRRKEKKNNVR